MNPFYKKVVAIAGILFLSAFFAFSQANLKTIPNSFVILGNLNADKLAFFSQSIEAADFEQYRLRDATVELNFKNGFKLELISAKDLTIKNKMQNVNPNLYAEKKSIPASYLYPVFEVAESGWIIAEMQATVTKPKK